jgi:tetratricopeptide (TPR) repeat protein
VTRLVAAVLACALAAALDFSPRVARADTPPTAWDLARDPAEADRWALHVRVERMLERGPSARFPDGELELEAARAMLEDAGAARSPDVRLRFDLGIVYGRLDLHRRVVDVLGPAIDAAPDHPAATRALEALAYAYAKLNRPRDELAAWRRFIPRLVDDRARATEMMNMGEAEMRLGSIEDALATFREVLELCGELPNSDGVNSTYVLTLWDLAVALDRSGDPRGALDTATKAMAWTWQKVAVVGPSRTLVATSGWDAIHDTSSVFFVPDWEREWYLAVANAAAARAASDVREAARLWSAAEHHRDTYVLRASASAASASGTADPWLAIARRRQSEARGERAAASRRAAKLPPLHDTGRTWDDD